MLSIADETSLHGATAVLVSRLVRSSAAAYRRDRGPPPQSRLAASTVLRSDRRAWSSAIIDHVDSPEEGIEMICV